MSCDRMPEIWPEPLPRFAVLPGDPPALRRWLQEQAAQDPDVAEEPSWPDEEAS